MDANHFNIAELALSPTQLNMVKLLKIEFCLQNWWLLLS